MSDTESTNQDEIGPPDEGSYEFYDRTPSPSSTSSSSVDARINDMFDEDELDGYLDTSTHHFPGRFSFEDPIAPSFRLPGDLVSSTMNGDVALDGMLSVSLDSDEELKKQNILFWKNLKLIRPVVYSRIAHGVKNSLYGFRFSDRNPEPYSCAIVGHWLDIHFEPWLKVRIKFIDGGFCYQWEPMNVTMQSVIAPEVAFYVFKHGLIQQHHAWWIVKDCMYKIGICPQADYRQNRAFLRAFEGEVNNTVV